MSFTRHLVSLGLAAGAISAAAQDKPMAAPVSAWERLEAEAAAAPAEGFNHARSAVQGREKMKAFYATYADWKAPEPLAAAPGKLPNLPDKPAKPRFELTGKTWPARPGEASVCLWEDDKTAAGSMSIDDNCAMDVPAWAEISQRYGDLKITWYLISGNLEGTLDPGRRPMAGTPELWREQLAKGLQIQSHSVTHVANPVLEDGWPGPDWEAAESRRQLETLLGTRVRMWAGPGSAIKEFNMSSNWRPSVVKYYAAARGFSGIPISPVNQIDYFDIRTTANPANLFSDDPKHAASQLRNILDADPASPQHKYYRGWATVFIHGLNIQGSDIANHPRTAAFAKVLEFFHQNREEIWVGYMMDVAMYGQERDTAQLTTVSATEDRIHLTLTSQMDPGIFDYPLTIKVRLPGTWKTAQATQGSSPAPCTVKLHEGTPYALVKARPDRGEITITP
jgi:hypothetical protein